MRRYIEWLLNFLAAVVATVLTIFVIGVIVGFVLWFGYVMFKLMSM